MDTPPRPPHTELQARLSQLMLRDEQRLRRRLHTARRLRDRQARQAALVELASEVDAAQQRVDRRRAGAPEVRYPPELPVSQRRDELLATIRDHQVVVVAGETGSGKTTQLPKICLELGRGVRGLIGHTQPRRIAARSVADRIAEELGTTLGDAVGYTVRFTDQVGENTLVKLMTDGILLAEVQRDRLLCQYDTLIIDEAHERSLNIDFILGYLKQLLPRRPDLKVIITSATIDPERFARHFDSTGVPAPVVEVSGRTYPVGVRYRPTTEPPSSDRPSSDGGRQGEPVRDQVQAICDAVEELSTAGPGDILVFLSGEREIRDTADALARLTACSTETVQVLPLYARLSIAEQHRVFQPHPGRRIVLATNVAETSLTVPGIRYVVDPGTARISRYSHRLKVQRLPIEAISQASANQRAGRCGRLAAGVCIRLYSEEDLRSRPEFTDPEILRTNLASVILQMAALGLGEVGAFPFLDPPDRRNISDGIQLLEELGALHPGEPDPRKRLTETGRRLAQLPIDPRLARMVLEADRNDCVREVLVITAALSIQDPRERPLDRQQAADDKHRRFSTSDLGRPSDFMAYLRLWSYLQEQQQALSANQFRRLCTAEFLHYLRVREWQDLVGQLRQVAKTLGITPSREPADPDPIHRSLLAGLLSHIGLKDVEKQEYLGARGARFAIFPGSALFKKAPRWVMAAELVETSRLWGRTAAGINPEWVEPLAGHLVRRSYSEPHWERSAAAVLAYEKVTLYGVPIVVSRSVSYGRIDPGLSRQLFIQHALVEGDWDTRHEFFHVNRRLLRQVEELEHRARRRGIVADDETLFRFYDERVGADVVSGGHFDSWWKKVRLGQPDLLRFDRSMLVGPAADEVAEEDFPDVWRQDGLTLPLTYQFEPGSAADGVTVHVPLALFNQLAGDAFSWQVPGLREDLVTALIRSLPKPLRRSFVPAPNYAKAVLARVQPGDGPLAEAVGRELERMGGPRVSPDDWQLDRVPGYLRMTVDVLDEQGRTLAMGKDVAALREQLRPTMHRAISAALADAAREVEQEGLVGWSIASLPRTIERRVGGQRVVGYPALVDCGAGVAVRVLGTPAEQRQAMWPGTRRLLLLTAPSPVKPVLGRLDNATKLALSQSPHGSGTALFEDCIACAADALIADRGGPAWDAAGFARLQDAVRADLADTLASVVVTVAQILTLARQLDGQLASLRTGGRGAAVGPALDDLTGQLTRLVYPGFVAATGLARLPQLPRYLQAMQRRLQKLPQDPARDRARMTAVAHVEQAYRELLDELPAAQWDEEAVRQVRWMIEELRVSYFAQALGTPYPISEKRIYRAIDELAR